MISRMMLANNAHSAVSDVITPFMIFLLVCTEAAISNYVFAPRPTPIMSSFANALTTKVTRKRTSPISIKALR